MEVQAAAMALVTIVGSGGEWGTWSMQQQSSYAGTVPCTDALPARFCVKTVHSVEVQWQQCKDSAVCWAVEALACPSQGCMRLPAVLARYLLLCGQPKQQGVAALAARLEL